MPKFHPGRYVPNERAPPTWKSAEGVQDEGGVAIEMIQEFFQQIYDGRSVFLSGGSRQDRKNATETELAGEFRRELLPCWHVLRKSGDGTGPELPFDDDIDEKYDSEAVLKLYEGAYP